MARLKAEGVQAAVEAARVWRERCLVLDGSLFADTSLWTLKNLETLEGAFFGNPVDDPRQSFLDKLQKQVITLPLEIPQLCAELTWAMLLFPYRIKGDRKCDDVRRVWSWSGTDLPATHPMLESLRRSAVGHTGMAFNALRGREFGFLVRAMRRLKHVSVADRLHLLEDPWAFAAWLDGDPNARKRPMRHLLAFLLFPDSFERIAANRHKLLIVRQFMRTLESTDIKESELRRWPASQVDRKLLDIRTRLQEKYHDTELDFYRPPLSNELNMVRRTTAASKECKEPPPLDKSSREYAGYVLTGFSKGPARRAVLMCLADCIAYANQLDPYRWSVALRHHSVRFTVGTVPVFSSRRVGCRIAVIVDQLGAAAPAHFRDRVLEGTPISTVVGAYSFQVQDSEFLEVLEYLKPALYTLIEAAIQTPKRPHIARAYSPTVLEFLDAFSGKTLPRPTAPMGDDFSNGPVPPPTLVSLPRSGFRATELDLAALVSDIEAGDIGLPDIQRPFVWTNAKVRDLFDSMYRGYPVGYLLFWETPTVPKNSRFIGTNDKAYRSPKRLIVDGQQRLTSLFAVMRNREILDEDYRPRRIEIAFRPRDGKFEVADAAIRHDAEFLPDVSQVLMDDRGSYSVVSEFLEKLQRRRGTEDEEKQIIVKNLERLFGLRQYRFSILEISSEMPDDAVADIFVRINSEGVKLNQADFILTLLSVFWEEGRRQLEGFCRSSKRPPERPGSGSPYNHLFYPSPDQLLRVSVALAFARARFKSVYHLLRGKNPDTGALEQERREEQLAKLKEAQAATLDVDNWQRFLGCITATGFRIADQVPSASALVMAYALHLYGSSRVSLDSKRLDRLVGQWFFMSVVTSRYSGSTETVMEQDLSRVAQLTRADAFEAALQSTINGALTGDFWTSTLPMELESSRVSGSPGWAAFVAAQVRLNAPVLFSEKSVWMALDPLTRGSRKPLELHHIFPKSWLVRQRISDRKQTDQIANMALLEWPDNARVSSRGPTEYLSELRSGFEEGNWQRMCRLHALPPDWEKLEYADFLRERRFLMAGVVRRAFEDLSGESATRGDAATVNEELAWAAISKLEKRLRLVVGNAYRRRWGQGIEDQARGALGDSSWVIIEKNREKHRRQYPLASGVVPSEVFDFMYLGQLVGLMLNVKAWDLFKLGFKDKRQLEDFAASIIPVRNDAAHFRSVPEKELQRCVIAVDDLYRILARLPPDNGSSMNQAASADIR